MELLDRFARGDLEAFELLFRQFHRDVYGWLVRLIRDPGALVLLIAPAAFGIQLALGKMLWTPSGCPSR